MKGKQSGIVSRNLLSLQLQLKTILEDAGGDQAVEFLDTVARLNRSEQLVALRLFSRVVERFLAGPVRLETAADQSLQEFEDTLYDDLLGVMREAGGMTGPREVIDGGKSPARATPPIDLDAARRARRNRSKPLFN